jgi:hypothetical protein
MRARWLNTVLRGFDDVGYGSASEVFLALGDLHIHQFAGKCTWHKHHSPISQTAQGISTGDKPFNTYLFAIHSY